MNLLRCGRLAAIDEWARHHETDLGGLEFEFLYASRMLAEREMATIQSRWYRPGELQKELRKREGQVLEQATRLRQQEDQLRKQAARLHELAVFNEKLATTGGVFISYSHDNDVVDNLARRFETDRINYWRDEKDLFVGDVIDKAISKGIREARLFLIVLTPKSISSPWVWSAS
jgi:TIR domain